MYESHELVVKLNKQHLSPPSDPFKLPAHELGQGRIEGLQCVHSRCERALDTRARDRLADGSRGYLDLGELRHMSRLAGRIIRDKNSFESERASASLALVSADSAIKV